MPINKPTIDKLFDLGMHQQYGIKFDFNNVADRAHTQTFVLSEEVALAAEKLIKQPSFIPPDIHNLHLPYPYMAVEYELTPQIREMRGVVKPGAHPIRSVGVHMRTVENKVTGTQIVCHPYWEFTTGVIHCSLFTFIFGLPSDGLPVMEFGNSNFAPVKAVVIPVATVMSWFENSGVPPEQAVKIFTSKELATHMHESGEELPIMLFACGALLSCKSGVTQKHIKAKAPAMHGVGERKRKALSHNAYTVVHLSALETVDDDGAVTSKVDMAAHYVRGHFKQRRTGVYWWSPFIRGNGELRKRDAYIIKE